MNLYGFAGGDPVNFSDPFGLCPESMRSSDGTCPGGLSIKEWDQVQTAMTHLKDESRGRVSDLVNAGKLHGGKLSLNIWGSTGGRLDRTAGVNINRAYFNRSTQSLASHFDDAPAELANTLAHESQHFEQQRGLGFLGRLASGYYYGTDKNYQRAVEGDAETYAKSQVKP